ncbi:O-antigen ligase family protein [Glaciecola sp. 1036]|uniref:O-antigen ligase family protein n=1 Tax=Alteromonadaceae TaxID=72275 RepID=UPI003D00FD26
MVANTNSSDDFLKLPFYFLLAILFLLPIPLGANRPWAWSFFELAIFALSFLVAWKLRGNKFAGMHKYVSMLIMWMVFIGIAVIQIVSLPDVLVSTLSPQSYEFYAMANATSKYLSIDVGQSTINFIKLLSLFCLLCLILQLINSENRLRLLLLTIVASGTFQAIYGSLEILLGLDSSLIFGLEIDNRASGSFVYHNHFANFLMLCLAAGVGLIVTALEKEKSSSPKDFMRSFAISMLSSKAIIRICLAVMVIGLVMSRSRMGNTAFFASMAITGLLALVLIRNRSQGLFILVVSMFIIDLLIVSAYFGLERVKQRLEQTSLDQETRDEIIREAMPIVQDFPWFGTGGGSFYSVFPGYQQSNFSLFYDHAHNDYLQFVIEYGLLGTLILCGITAFALYKSLRAMYKRKNSIFKGVGFASCMAILGMGLHMTVDFPLQGYANACYFVVFIGLAMISNGLKLRMGINKIIHN